MAYLLGRKLRFSVTTSTAAQSVDRSSRPRRLYSLSSTRSITTAERHQPRERRRPWLKSAKVPHIRVLSTLRACQRFTIPQAVERRPAHAHPSLRKIRGLWLE